MEDYIARINRVIDYIENNLSNSFSLEELAKVAHFSKYHFHRIFFSLMGETLFRFIQRVRVERAATRLVFESQASITNIALDCGFSSSTFFSRTFKEKFGCSPTEWRKQALFGNQLQTNSNLSTSQSNKIKDIPLQPEYLGSQNNIQKWKLTAKNRTHFIDVFDQAEIPVAYIRHMGPYAQNVNLFERLNKKLFSWAAPRGLVRFSETQYLIICHDNPTLTDDDKLRISVCISVPEDTATSGQIGKMVVPAGKYAHVEFQVKPLEIGNAWDWAYGCWLPVSGFVADDRPCYELYALDDSKKGVDDLIDLEICIPVRPF